MHKHVMCHLFVFSSYRLILFMRFYSIVSLATFPRILHKCLRADNDFNVPDNHIRPRLNLKLFIVHNIIIRYECERRSRGRCRRNKSSRWQMLPVLLRYHQQGGSLSRRENGADRGRKCKRKVKNLQKSHVLQSKNNPRRRIKEIFLKKNYLIDQRLSRRSACW